ncbi:MAG: hypothetical protein FWC61_00995 [Proteobacteria bacterium]|nr:hypothetical protein [Pseudomonadota bacterium]
MKKTAKKNKNLLPNWRAAAIVAAGMCVITGATAYLWHVANRPPEQKDYVYENTGYGLFLAEQHALYMNDFESAAKFADQLSDVDINIVNTAGQVSRFLAGNLDDSARSLKKETRVPLQLIYATHLIKNGDWAEVYSRFANNNSGVLSPIRIWSSVAVGKDADAIKFVDSLKHTSESWRNFTVGMIYAETGRKIQAKGRFGKVSLDFLNLNDYAYLMNFYKTVGYDDAAGELRANFTSRPAGLYMLNQDAGIDPAAYAGARGALAFSLIQTVAHSAPMMQSDLAIMLLRMAELVRPDAAADNGAAGNDDALNYYTGMYFYENDGNYRKYFDRIGKKSPYYPFILLKNADKVGDFDSMRAELSRAVKKNPLFVPAIMRLVGINVQHGRQNDALGVLDGALGQPNLGDIGRAFLLKTRARVNLAFGDIANAQKDVDAATATLPADAGILSEQVRIWIAENKNLDEAYAYSLAFVKKYPSEIEAWDTLGLVVWKKDGARDALAIYEKVGWVAESVSSLFEHLGDVYAELGDASGARDAYLRALKLSDDGLTIESVLNKKLRNLK